MMLGWTETMHLRPRQRLMFGLRKEKKTNPNRYEPVAQLFIPFILEYSWLPSSCSPQLWERSAPCTHSIQKQWLFVVNSWFHQSHACGGNGAFYAHHGGNLLGCPLPGTLTRLDSLEMILEPFPVDSQRAIADVFPTLHYVSCRYLFISVLILISESNLTKAIKKKENWLWLLFWFSKGVADIFCIWHCVNIHLNYREQLF